MIARYPGSVPAILPPWQPVPSTAAAPVPFRAPSLSAAAMPIAQLQPAKPKKSAKYAFSVIPQEKHLAKMADATTRSHIASLRRPSPAGRKAVPQFVLLFDFDHTLSTEDSGEKLAREHGIANPGAIFGRMRQADPSVRPGGELAAALAIAPEFSAITQQHLEAAGRGVSLKANVKRVFDSLSHAGEDYRLSLFVLSAGPTETIRTALEGIVPASQVQGTRMRFDDNNDKHIEHVTAGQGKADFIDALLRKLHIPASHLLFAGDGSSDEMAFRYSQERGGFNILVKQNPSLLPLSHAQVYGDDLAGVIDVVRNHIANALHA